MATAPVITADNITDFYALIPGQVAQVDPAGDYERILNLIDATLPDKFCYQQILAGTEMFTMYGYGFIIVTEKVGYPPN